MSDTEIRMMRYTIEQLSEELQATIQYVSDIETKLERTRKALEIAVDALNKINMRCQNTVRNHLERATIRGELCDISFYARKAIGDIDNLKRITALEQKESAFVRNKIEFPEFNDNLLEEFDKQFFENGQDDDLTETALEQKDVK